MGQRRLGKRWLIALALVAALRVMLYAGIIPPWQGPDEPKHYEYVALLDRLHRSLDPKDVNLALERQIIESLAEFRYWEYWGRPTPEVLPATFVQIWGPSSTLLQRAPLYYVAIWPIYHLVRLQPLASQLLLLRLSGLLFFVPTILLCWALAREIYPGRPDLAVGAALVVTWLPQFTAENSILSNDALAYLIGAAIALVAIGGITRGWTLRRLLGMIVLLGIGFLIKRTVVLLLPLVLVALLLGTWSRGGLARGVFLAMLVLGGGTVALWKSPALVVRINHLALDYPTQLAEITNRSHYTASALPLYGSYASWLFDSFWAYLGWAARPAPAWTYQILLGVTAWAVLGTLYAVLRGRIGAMRVKSASRRALFTCLIGITGAALGAMLFYSLYFNPRAVPQGRYLFPVIGPIAVVLIGGIASLWPDRGQRWCVPALVTFTVAFDVWYVAAFLVPYFYG